MSPEKGLVSTARGPAGPPTPDPTSESTIPPAGSAATAAVDGSDRRSRLDRTPLRVKLVLAVVALSAVVLVLAAVAATTALRGFLLEQVDVRLRSTFDQVAAQIEPTRVFLPPGFYVDVLDPQGQSVLARTRSLGPDVPDLPVLDAREVADRIGEPFTAPSVSGESDWRVMARPVPGDRTLVVATSRAEVDSALGRLVLLQAIIGAVALVVLAIAGSVLIRRSLRPLQEIESVAGDIAAGDLGRRVPDPDERTEVGRLAAALNGMLARIESAVRDREIAATTAYQSEQRMRQFVADASHELRTPLTSIRGFAELYRQGAVPDGPETGRAMARIESEAGRMNVLVEDLLLLARLDERRPVQHSAMDLLPLAIDAVYDARAVAPDREIELVTGKGPVPVVFGDEAGLRQVLGNLVSNALTHTPHGTPVQVRVRVDAAVVVVEVVDHGPGLDDAQAARVFERFYRADPARSRAAGGSGLGLAIVLAITASHRGRVEIDSTPGRGATFRLLLPRAPGAGEGNTVGR